jgi:predicted phage terminase large subunit-like protein
MTSVADAAKEILRRRRCRESLVGFAQGIDVPGRPIGDDDNAWIFNPVESPLAQHHIIILEAFQRCVERDNGRLMIFAPPGSAKSSYASVVGTSWAAGSFDDYRIILASYAQHIADKQSRRARQICRSDKFRSAMGCEIPKGQEAVNQWALTNGSEFMAAGMLSGITGSRADLVVIDDPISGREDADSERIRDKTYDAYLDDLKTRLKPRASLVIIQTRWHEDDLSGRILPDGYGGASGTILCRDGFEWEVLNIQAKSERLDDPLGRPLGAYMWPEWFDEMHWAQYENDPSPQAQRTWRALFQQRPSADSGGFFERAWFDGGVDSSGRERKTARYKAKDLPKLDRLRIFGGSDWAVTEKTTADYTEHGVWGMDDAGEIWALDWKAGQVNSEKGVEMNIDLIKEWRPVAWYGARGKDENAIQPFRDRRMIEERAMTVIELLPESEDKQAKAQSFRAMASMGRIHFPADSLWAERVISQLVRFPVGSHDDAVDVCAHAGRAVDRMWKPKSDPKKDEKPRFLHDMTAAEVFDLDNRYGRRTGVERI